MIWNRLTAWTTVFLSLALISGSVLFSALADVATTSLTVGVAQCSDGLDNDGDGLIDYPADPDCSSAVDDDESASSSGPPPGGGSKWYGDGATTTATSGQIIIGPGLFPPPPPPETLPGQILRLCDFNGDNRCDLSDLSILLYYQYLPQMIPAAARYDLTSDGVIDMADISILLYYWG